MAGISDGTAAVTVLQGDVFAVLPTLENGSVDCVTTSVPYWMLRSYLPKGHPLKHLELGSEATPKEYIQKQVKVFRLVRDAMADHATCWLNIGDTYLHDNRGGRSSGKHYEWHQQEDHGKEDTTGGMSAGSLALIPQRLAIALQDDGWLVRSIIVWHKPAPMPASISGWAWRRCRVKVRSKTVEEMPPQWVNDKRYSGEPARHCEPVWSDCPGCKRCTPHGGYVLRRGSWRPTSSWEPILMLAKTSRYFCDGEPVKTPAMAATVSRDAYTRVLDDPDEQFAVKHDHETTCDSGANLRDVWTIASEPLKERHYAAFPTALVEKCLRAGTSAKGYCAACGKPWARILESESVSLRPNSNSIRGHCPSANRSNGAAQRGAMSASTETVGWRPSCACVDAGEPRPALVLDPFAGSGRTGITARRLGLRFVGVELNEEYVSLCRRTIEGDAPLFNQP